MSMYGEECLQGNETCICPTLSDFLVNEREDGRVCFGYWKMEYLKKFLITTVKDVMRII